MSPEELDDDVTNEDYSEVDDFIPVVLKVDSGKLVFPDMISITCWYLYKANSLSCQLT